jgi:hypothetical protein
LSDDSDASAPDSLVPDSFLHILSVGNTPALITASTALLVCVSAVYMTAYFYIVGPQFQGFLSPSDYIVGSINWLPTLFFAAVYGIGSRPIYSLLGGRFKLNSDANFDQTVPASDIKRGVSIDKNVILIWLAINSLGLVLNLSISDRDQLPASISKIIFVNMVLGVPFVVFNVLDGVIPKKFAQLIVISIVMIAYVASRGISDAADNINIDIDNDPSATVYQILLPNENPKTATIIPLMNIDKGLIYKAKSDIHFAKWADISGFGRLNVEHSKTTLWCERFPNLVKFFCE